MRKPKAVTLKPGQSYFVHKYKYRHDKRRRQTGRWLNKGKVAPLNTVADGTYYRVIEEVTLA